MTTVEAKGAPPAATAPASPRVAQALAFTVPVALVLYYALRGGSYDIVVRQEEALAVWWVIALGYLAGLLPVARPPRVVLVPVAALFVLAVWTAFSLIWTESSERTFAELARVLHYAGVLVLVLALVDRTTWRAAAAGVAFAAVVVSGLALASRLDPGSFPRNYILRDFHTDRLSYPLNYWNAVAAWGAMTAAMALAWSAHARLVAVRAAALAAVPVVATATYLTYARQGIAGGALAVLAVLVLSRNRFTYVVNAVAAAGASWLAIAEVRRHREIVDATGGAGASQVILALLAAAAIAVAVAVATKLLGADRLRMPRRAGQVAAVAAVCVVVIVAATAGRHPIDKGWHQFRYHTTSAVAGPDPAARLTNLNGARYPQWRAAVKAFDSQPFHGIGSGAYEFWWNRTGGEGRVRNAHSLYLEMLAELGVPGLLLTVTALGGLLAAAVRTRRVLTGPEEVGASAALAAAFLVFLLHAGLDWVWQVTALSFLALIGMGIAIGAVSTRRVGRHRGALRAAVAIAALVAIAVELPGLVSTSKVRASQKSFRRGDIAAAIGQANDAVSSEPWAATPYTQRALINESLGAYAAARVDLERAISRERTNWQPRLLLARVEAEAGDPNAALAAFREARRLRPKGQFFPTGQ